jgi:hypothetical protein
MLLGPFAASGIDLVTFSGALLADIHIHHDLDGAFLVLLGVPVRAKCNNRVVEVHADIAAHANNHSLAVDDL